MITKELIKEKAFALKEETIRLRRHFHEYPELGFKEFETSKYIAEYLDKFGINYQKGIAKTGIVGKIEGKGPGKSILLRADMDALPVKELNDVPYKSKNEGVMHACGHDTHIAMLLTTLRILNEIKDEFSGTVYFVFQPAEEGPGGARPIVESGVLGTRENYKIDAALAVHVHTQKPTGVISTLYGEFTASSDILRFKIMGKGGHAAAPHETVDPIYIAAQIITSIYGWITRYVDPIERVVFTVGKVVAGERFNVIPDFANIEATLRTMNPEIREDLLKKIPEVANKIAEAFGGKVETRIERGYSPGVNDKELFELIKNSTIELFGEKYFELDRPSMGAEDFFEFSNNGKIPVAMFWLGGKNEQKGCTEPNHSPKFNIDEDALPYGVAVMTYTTLKFLGNK